MPNLFDDLRMSIWSELRNEQPISVHRRNLQKVFLEKMIALYKSVPQGPGASFDVKKSDIPSLARATLIKLQAEIGTAAAATNDSMSRYHLQDCLGRIEMAFER